MNKKLMSNNFSEWLKTNRKKSGLTLIQTRDRINNLCSDAYISRLENARYDNKKGKPPQPDIEIVDALAEAFGRPIDEARLAAGYAPIDNLSEIVPKTVIEAFAREGTLDSRDHDLIVNIIDTLKKQKRENE